MIFSEHDILFLKVYSTFNALANQNFSMLFEDNIHCRCKVSVSIDVNRFNQIK